MIILILRSCLTRSGLSVQFHPEYTLQGRIIDRFVKKVCKCKAHFGHQQDIVERIRVQVGSGRVILGMSGGVDSGVVAALLSRAIGDQLTCVFVDTACCGMTKRTRSKMVEKVRKMYMP